MVPLHVFNGVVLPLVAVTVTVKQSFRIFVLAFRDQQFARPQMAGFNLVDRVFLSQ